MTDIKITVVPDEYVACPECTAHAAHPNPALRFPNRFKVDNLCRCYNPACSVLYYDPATQEVVERKTPQNG